MRKIHGKQVEWLRTTYGTIAYSPKELAVHFLGTYLAICLAVYMALGMYADTWQGIRVHGKGILFLLAELLICQLVYQYLFPMLERRWKSYQGVLLRIVIVGIGCFLAGRFGLRYFRANQIDLEDGFLYMGRQLIEKYNLHFHANLRLEPGLEECVPQAITFVLVLLLFFLVNLQYLVQKHVVWMLPGVAVFGVHLWVGLTPNWKSQFLFCMTLYFLAGSEYVTGAVGKPWKGYGNKKKQGITGFVQSVLAIGLMLGCFGLVSLVGRVPAEKLLAKSPEVKAFQERVEINLREGKLLPVDASAITGRKNMNNKSPEFTGKEILTVVSAKKPSENLYLKEFQGDGYEYGDWTHKEKDFDSACTKSGIQKESLQTQLLQKIYDGMGELYHTEYELRYQMAGGSMLAPYLVDATSFSKGNMRGDVLLKRKGFGGTKRIGTILQQPGESKLWDIEKADMSEEEETLWNWYNQYVQEHYLEVPEDLEEVKRTAKRLINPWLTTLDNPDRMAYARIVAKYLQQFTYSRDLTEVPKGQDTIEYFMGTTRTGFCIHFASAGVLLLRSLGVPARYVSGYVVRGKEFALEDEGFVAHVPDENGHAWVEVYLDNLGWIPVDVTPGFSDAWLESNTYHSSELNTTVPPETEPSMENTEDIEEEEGTELPQENVEEEQEDFTESEETIQEATEEKEETEILADLDTIEDIGEQNPTGDKVNLPDKIEQVTEHKHESQTGPLKVTVLKILGKVFVWMLRIFVILLLLMGVGLFGYRMIRHYYGVVEGEFKRKRYRKLIKRINRRIYKGLRVSGKLRMLHPTDTQYEKALKEAYQAIPEESWMEYMRIVKQVAFSSEEIGLEQAKLCMDIYKNVKWMKL